MEQLFKCKTIKQQKIMEWLVSQGITGADIAHARLIGTAMVRVTNPAGQYMDIFCNDCSEVHILQVIEEREAELDWYMDHETEDPETAEWREDLTPDEATMVEQWDEQYRIAFAAMAQRILELGNRQPAPATPEYESEL